MVSIVLLLAGCGEDSGSESAISAREFDTRLSNMHFDLNARELAEISTLIMGASRSDFEQLDGWYFGVDVLGDDVLQKHTLLGGREVVAELSLNNNRVSRVAYFYDSAQLSDVTNHVAFGSLTGGDKQISAFTANGEMVELGDDVSAASELLVASILNRERVHLIFSWDYTNSNGDTASIQFSFASEQRQTGDNAFFEVVTFWRR